MVSDIESAFRLLITDDILDIVIRETNRYAENYYDKINNDPNRHGQRLTWAAMDMCELKAVICLLLHAGKDKSAHCNVKELWSVNARPIYKSVMNVERFNCILRFLRFDDLRTRPIRQETDKLAPYVTFGLCLLRVYHSCIVQVWTWRLMNS